MRIQTSIYHINIHERKSKCIISVHEQYNVHESTNDHVHFMPTLINANGNRCKNVKSL